MRVFKRYYHTLAKKTINAIIKEPDIIKIPMIQYLPTFDYSYNEPLLMAYG